MQLLPNANYWIARGQEVFGPYTGSQVREYLASGNIVPSDMIRGESDGEWINVAVLLGLPPAPTPSAGPFSGAAVGSVKADPGRTWAVWGVGSGAFGILCCSCAGPIAIVLGVVALVVGQRESRGLAWTALILGIVGVLLNVGLYVFFQMYPELDPFASLMNRLQAP